MGKDVQGPTLIERVGGDFFLQGSGGTVNSRAGGDVQVSLTQVQPGSFEPDRRWRYPGLPAARGRGGPQGIQRG